MKKTLRVYGGSGHRYEPRNTNPHKQTREIVAATSMTAALRLLSPFHVTRPYMSETGNAVECAIAMSKPGTVFWAPLASMQRTDGDFIESGT